MLAKNEKSIAQYDGRWVSKDIVLNHFHMEETKNGT